MTIVCYIQNENQSITSIELETLMVLARNHKLDPRSYVWTSLDEQWVPAEEWSRNILNKIAKVPEEAGAKWTIEVNDLLIDDLTFDQVVDRVFVYPDAFIKIKLSSENDSSFKSLQHYPRFVTAVQSRYRKHRRVPIIASVRVLHPAYSELVLQVRDISLGGVGLQYHNELSAASSELEIMIESASLDEPLQAKARIAQSSKERDILNLQFTSMAAEHTKILSDYVDTTIQTKKK